MKRMSGGWSDAERRVRETEMKHLASRWGRQGDLRISVLGDELILVWQDGGGDAARLMTITPETCVCL